MAILFKTLAARRCWIYPSPLAKAAKYEMTPSSQCAKARNHAQDKASLEGCGTQAPEARRVQPALHSILGDLEKILEAL